VNHFSAVANTIRMPLGTLVDWLSGCPHRKKTFPITLRNRVRVGGKHIMQAETYTVCVECGRHFAYDWATMRTADPRSMVAAGERIQTLQA
jgi:hypothetical protein